MSKPMFFFLGLISILTLSINSALAQCRKDPREVHVKDEQGRDVALKFSSFVCQIRGNDQGAHLGVEFFRLGNQAASMVVSGNSYLNLSNIFGSLDIQKTSVFAQFKYLVDHFSVSEFSDTATMHFISSIYTNTHYEYNGSFYFHSNNVNRAGIVDYLLGSDPEEEYFTSYPAIQDVQQLDQRIIPNNMSVFYMKSTKSDKPPQVVFWRYGTLQDVMDYQANMAAWNTAARLNKGLEPFPSPQNRKTLEDESYKKFLGLSRTLSGGHELPKGYLILSGQFVQEKCGEPSWTFHMDSPAIELEVILIRNTSDRAVRLDALIGNESGEARLRPAEAALPPPVSSVSSISIGSVISPGRSLLVPIRILLRSRYLPPEEDAAIKGVEVYRRLISKGISARPDVYGQPMAPNFAFGPQLDVSGITVDGNTIKLSPQSTNLMDVSFAWGLGSCPYLASWDKQRKQWLEYGKVLHPADERRHESVQSVVLPGFVSRFRLEEREPEVTTLDRAELLLTLRGGKQVAGRPANTHGDDMLPFHLFWDEAQEFEFALPQGVSAGDVLQSRLVLTGFYQRYSNLPNFSPGAGSAYLRAAFPSEPKPSH